MPENLSLTKDEFMRLLKEAFSSGVFSYLDLADSECQKIFNDFVNCKLNADDVSNLNVNVKLNKKSNTSVSDLISSNYFYNYSTSWGNTYQ